MSLDSITFTVSGAPTGKGRPRATVRGRHAAVYTDAKTRAAEDSFLAQALPFKPARPLLGPLSVSIECACQIPASWSKRKRAEALLQRIQPLGKPDVDNVAKLILDTLNGVFYVDDTQVTILNICKRYGDVPQTTVAIAYYVEEQR
jgi:Holliday junction resolvase RusA-like endonuclease